MPDLADEGVPYGSQLTVRATADPNGTALIVIAKDGAETALTWAGLERAANRWARALQSSAVTQGAMVALSIPNSTELVVAALAAWKVGAIPIPMRWDLPDWEQQRLLEVIDPALVLSETNLAGAGRCRERRGRQRATAHRVACAQRHLQFRFDGAAEDHPQHRAGDVDPAQ